jgi:hypothetical protein
MVQIPLEPPKILEFNMKSFVEIHMIILDPPAGWRYGFPKAIKTNVTEPGNASNIKFPSDDYIKEFLLKNNFPKNDLDTAMQYSRMWIITKKVEML